MTTTLPNIKPMYSYKHSLQLDVPQLISDLIDIHDDWHTAETIADLHYDENRLAEIIEVLEDYVESQPCR